MKWAVVLGLLACGEAAGGFHLQGVRIRVVRTSAPLTLCIEIVN